MPGKVLPFQEEFRLADGLTPSTQTATKTLGLRRIPPSKNGSKLIHLKLLKGECDSQPSLSDESLVGCFAFFFFLLPPIRGGMNLTFAICFAVTLG